MRLKTAGTAICLQFEVEQPENKCVDTMTTCAITNLRITDRSSNMPDEPKQLTELRKVVEASEESLRSIARATGLDVSQISRFVKGERGLTMESAESILRHLGYEIRIVRKKPAAKRRKK